MQNPIQKDSDLSKPNSPVGEVATSSKSSKLVIILVAVLLIFVTAALLYWFALPVKNPIPAVTTSEESDKIVETPDVPIEEFISGGEFKGTVIGKTENSVFIRNGQSQVKELVLADKFIIYKTNDLSKKQGVYKKPGDIPLNTEGVVSVELIDGKYRVTLVNYTGLPISR